MTHTPDPDAPSTIDVSAIAALDPDQLMDRLINLYMSGYGSGFASAIGSVLSGAMSGSYLRDLTEHECRHIALEAQSACDGVLADPATRTTVMDSIEAVFIHDRFTPGVISAPIVYEEVRNGGEDA